MSELTERLKVGLAEAQKSHAEVTRRWQAMQVEFNTSNAVVVGYQKVLELETQRELQQAASAVSPTTISEPKSKNAQTVPTEEVNKAQVIRDALSEHPNVTPVQLWGAVREKVPNRNYVYSVLARLNAKGVVTVKRGRYSIKVTGGEDSEPKQPF